MNELTDREQFAKDSEERANQYKYRVFSESSERSQNRDEYRRDYARVLYSSSFRRLQGKMQLLGIDPTHFHRNRLTHSLEVAQIAGSIARQLKLTNPIVAETCSLAHDLGNPPFGHAGEKVLNKLAQDFGGYEGNAQTFRILRSLEKKHYEYRGLNLTIRTLLGITKYFQKREDKSNQINNKKLKFLYDDDYDFLNKEISKNRIFIKKSIDAQIMDIADEIAYAAHDLEDALSFGFVTVAEMMHEFENSSKYKSVSGTFKKIAYKSREVATKANLLETSEEYSFLLRKELTSNIVDNLIKDIDTVECADGSKQIHYKNLELLAEGLKKIVFKTLLRKPSVQLYEQKGEKVIQGLFEVYTDTTFNKNLYLLPPEFRFKDQKSSEKRVVVDYIAGMMDYFAVQEYKRYFGSSSLDKIYDRSIWPKPD